MSFGSDHALLLDRLEEVICIAPKPTGELFAKIVAGACTRVPILTRSGSAGALSRLVESEAWADAALTLVQLELPGWSLRRLIREHGIWVCSLSRQPNVPADFDDTADGRHDVMPLAVLRAFLEARRMAAALARPAVPISTVVPMPTGFVDCENFA